MPVEGEGEWPDAEAPDLANLGTTPPGPPPSSQAPVDTEPHRVTQVEMSEGEGEDDAPLPEFDPKVRQDFEGLLYLGRLTDTFSWMGHTFTIRTLTSGEVLEVGLLHKPYVGTLADVKAYQAAVVAACVLEVDGKPMPVPITNDPSDTALVNRFQYVLRSWFPPTLDAVYEQFLLLEDRVEKVMAAMGKASGRNGATPTLSTASA